MRMVGSDPKIIINHTSVLASWWSVGLGIVALSQNVVVSTYMTQIKRLTVASADKTFVSLNSTIHRGFGSSTRNVTGVCDALD